MGNIEIGLYTSGNNRGGTISRIDRAVTVQDYLDAVNDFIVSAPLDRLWGKRGDSCRGCDYCCHEPLPVTSIDVLNLITATKKSFTEVFSYLWVEVRGELVDITLRRDKKQSCCFLSPQGTCTIYSHRPLVCQTYICFVTTPEMEDIRGILVNSGMDDLIRRAIIDFAQIGRTIPINKGVKPKISLKDWPPNIYSGKNSYRQIELSQVLPARLLNRTG